MFEHFVASSLLAVVSTNALAGQKICMSIGRTEMPAFSAQNDGKIWITAPLIGSVSAASGTITAQLETKSGLNTDLSCYFLHNTGGAFHTQTTLS